MDPDRPYEININSDKPAKDRVTHRVGVLGSYTPTHPRFIESHFVETTVEFTTDRSYDAKIGGATIEYSPTDSRAAIGLFTPGNAIKFRWRPYLGVEYGHVWDAGPLSDLDPNYTNAFLRLAPELVVFDRIKFAPTLTWWQQLSADKELFAFYEWAARVVLFESDGKERASVEFAYNQGREAPGFDKTGVFKTAFAVKF